MAKKMQERRYHCRFCGLSDSEAERCVIYNPKQDDYSCSLGELGEDCLMVDVARSAFGTAARGRAQLRHAVEHMKVD